MRCSVGVCMDASVLCGEGVYELNHCHSVFFITD